MQLTGEAGSCIYLKPARAFPSKTCSALNTHRRATAPKSNPLIWRRSGGAAANFVKHSFFIHLVGVFEICFLCAAYFSIQSPGWVLCCCYTLAGSSRGRLLLSLGPCCGASTEHSCMTLLLGRSRVALLPDIPVGRCCLPLLADASWGGPCGALLSNVLVRHVCGQIFGGDSCGALLGRFLARHPVRTFATRRRQEETTTETPRGHERWKAQPLKTRQPPLPPQHQRHNTNAKNQAAEHSC